MSVLADGDCQLSCCALTLAMFAPLNNTTKILRRTRRSGFYAMYDTIRGKKAQRTEKVTVISRISCQRVCTSECIMGCFCWRELYYCKTLNQRKYTLNLMKTLFCYAWHTQQCLPAMTKHSSMND